MTEWLDYATSLTWLDELYRRPFVSSRRAGLRRIARFMDELGNPQHSFRAVHVAGSSGKGSTTTMIGSILQSCGYRTGYFRSPHVESPVERIAVDGQLISVAHWEEAFNTVLPIASAMEMDALPGYDLGRPTFFEVFFAMMAVHFRAQGVQWGAIETGIGGRLDATNILQSDVAVITNISLEHTNFLGNTITAIAGEKAAIIKRGSHAVSAVSQADARKVIRDRAADTDSPLREVENNVNIRVRDGSVTGQRLHLSNSNLAVDARLALPGAFQVTNAATAFLAAVALRDRGVDVPGHAIARGLEAARIPGRLEVAQHEPLILLDGAHNAGAAEALAEALAVLFPDTPIVLLFAAMEDKDIEAMARALSRVAQRVVCTTAPGTDRAASPSRSVAAFTAAGVHADTVGDVDAALQRAITLAASGAVLVICGSLYLVGYVRRLLSTPRDTT